MDIKNLKNYLYENNEKIFILLEKLGCHDMRLHNGISGDDYITFGNPDGDNSSAVTVYLSPSLLTINYTRDICTNKKSCDLIDLCKFYLNKNLFDTLKWIADAIGIEYYMDFNSEIPQSLRILRKMKDMLVREMSDNIDNTPIQKRDEIILSYYFPYVNDVFYEDNISYETQVEFEVGYDPRSNRITIPIRDEIGNLVGIKGRWLDRTVPDGIEKYLYLETCPRGRILYGYNKTKNYIEDNNSIYVVESEKGLLQLWSSGIRNAVATGGTKLSRIQIENLSRMNKKIVLCFDKDFTPEKIQTLRNKFLPQIDFWALIDYDDILKDKESPSDNINNFEKLLNKNLYKIERNDESEI